MKLVRFGDPGRERPGVISPHNPNKILDIRALAYDIEDYDSHFFSHCGLQRVKQLLSDTKQPGVALAEVRLGCPVSQAGKIICIGENYLAHAKEFGHAPPEEPILFSKPSSSIIGPADPIRLPERAGRVDCEVELALIIGRETSHVPAERAMEQIAGFTILDDITSRTVQKNRSQWFHSKGFDTFCPIGPWMVTSDELLDPSNLRLKSKLNGTILQNCTTDEMIFTIPELIQFISASITLQPGDIIASGTPQGIGSSHNPPLTLRKGDQLELSIEGLGSQTNSVE